MPPHSSRFVGRVVFCVAAWSATATQTCAAPRNILVVVTDDESPTLGCYGDPVAVTPALDALAADGTLFTHAFATTASCSASRSVILSGLHNHANGQYGHQHDFHKFASWHDVVSLSLPRALATAGYRTARIGKFHVAPEEVYHFEQVLPGESAIPSRWPNAVGTSSRPPTSVPSSSTSPPPTRTVAVASMRRRRSSSSPTSSATCPRGPRTPASTRWSSIRPRFRCPRSCPTRPRPAPNSPSITRAVRGSIRDWPGSSRSSARRASTTRRSSSSRATTAWPSRAGRRPSTSPASACRWSCGTRPPRDAACGPTRS